MDAIQILALSAAIKDKDFKLARKEIGSGQHEIDMTVRVKGYMVIDADTDKKPTVSVPLKETMAFLIKRMGITREAAKEALLGALKDAIQETKRGKGSILSEHPEIEETLKQVDDLMGELPRTPVKGAIRSALTVEVQN